MRFPKMYKKKEKKMSERTQEQLNHDYANALARLGEAHYRIDKMKEDVKRMNSEIDALQVEAAALNAKKTSEVSAVPDLVEETVA